MKSLTPERNYLKIYRPSREPLHCPALAWSQPDARHACDTAECMVPGDGVLSTSSRPVVNRFAALQRLNLAKARLRYTYCQSNTMGCSANCAEKRKHWLKSQRYWCYKKSSRPCGRTRRSDQLPTASEPASAGRAVRRQWCSPVKARTGIENSNEVDIYKWFISAQCLNTPPNTGNLRFSISWGNANTDSEFSNLRAISNVVRK